MCSHRSSGPTTRPKSGRGKSCSTRTRSKYSRPGVVGGVLAFYTLAVFARPDRGRPFVAAVEAVPKLNQGVWDRFLRTLPGQPDWVVTDGGSAVLGGTRKAWPDAEMWRCGWHLRKNLTDALPRHVQIDLADPFHPLLNKAQVSVQDWEAYRAAVLRRSRQETDFAGAVTRASSLHQLISVQAATRPDDLPVSTGPLEQFFNTVGGAIGDRAATMTNKRRADALLKLIAAQRNGWTSHERWTELIRDHLIARRGHAAHQRRSTDSRATPSLR